MKINDLDGGALVSRLCHYYQSEGDSVEHALQKVRSGLGQEYSNAVDLFESSLSTNAEASPTTNKASDSIVASLSENVSLLGGDNSQLLNIANQVLSRVRPGFKSCARFFSALFLYPSILFVMSILIYGVYKIFVFPSMIAGVLNENVPRLSQLFFSDTAGLLVLIGAIILIVFFVWQMIHLARSFSKIKPKKTLLGSLIGTDQHHAYLVFLAYFKILLKCGADPSESFGKAQAYANLDTISTDYYRHNKNALAVLKGDKSSMVLQEVDHQLEDVMRGLDHALTSKQEIILLLSQLTIIAFIGYMVIAMYLPIFKLASIF